MVQPIELSVIIVSWQVKDLLLQTLSSLFSTKQKVFFEVIVIDNNSQDGSAIAVKKLFPQVKLIANTKNVGFAKACHQGVALANGDLFLFLNDDTKIFDYTLDGVVEFYKNNQSAGVMGSLILNPDMSWQPSVRHFPNYKNLIIILLKLHHIFPNLLNTYLYKNFDFTKLTMVDQVMGAFFATPRVVWEKLHGFDTKYFIWFEEVDYCWRVRQANYQVFFNPKVKAIHYGGASFHQLKALPEQIFFNKSVLTYAKKNYNTLQYLLILLVIPINLILTSFIHLAEFLILHRR
ncbi:MAG: glycosyltransferase family 2 protein [Candidatus Margulisiibacteriota bacterium]|jgi:hypothetical protein